MSYQYLSATIDSIDPSGTPIRPTKSFLPTAPVTTPEFSMGERLLLSLQIDASFRPGSKFRRGQQFCFNLRLFSSPEEIYSFVPQGRGWLIKLIQGPTGLEAAWKLSTGGREARDQNFRIVDITFNVSERIMTLDFEFYITQDLMAWIGFETLINEQRFLLNQRNALDELDNSTEGAFKRDESYMEVAFFECDSNLVPLTTTGPTPQDPIARVSSQRQYETLAIKCGLKWYDQTVGAQNDWASPTAKQDNWLKSIEVNAGNYTTPITQVDHKGFGFDYESVLQNFIFDRGDSTTQLVVNNIGDPTADKNNVTIKIGSPNLTNPSDYSNVIVYLVRTEQSNDSVIFTESYQLAQADIPKAQPLVTILDGPIETPSSWGVAGGELTIDFILNGEQLEPNATYHILVLTYDNAADFSSTHLSPPLTSSLANVNVPTATSSIITYNNIFGNTINDLSVTNYERVRLQVILDGNAYGTTFADDLGQVRLTQQILGETVQNVTATRFPNGPSTGQPQIEITDLGGNFYAFEIEFRSYFAESPAAPRRSFHRWEFEFSPTGFNQPDAFTFRLEQRLSHREEDTTRLPNIRFLEFGPFPGSLIEKFFICENLDEKIVIEVEKNGAPNANLIAMLINDTPTVQPPTVFPNVDEEESYAGNLTQLSSAALESVDVDFAAQLDPDKAYFVADVAFLAQSKYFNALIYNL